MAAARVIVTLIVALFVVCHSAIIAAIIFAVHRFWRLGRRNGFLGDGSGFGDVGTYGGDAGCGDAGGGGDSGGGGGGGDGGGGGCT